METTRGGSKNLREATCQMALIGESAIERDLRKSHALRQGSRSSPNAKSPERDARRATKFFPEETRQMDRMHAHLMSDLRHPQITLRRHIPQGIKGFASPARDGLIAHVHSADCFQQDETGIVQIFGQIVGAAGSQPACYSASSSKRFAIFDPQRIAGAARGQTAFNFHYQEAVSQTAASVPMHHARRTIYQRHGRRTVRAHYRLADVSGVESENEMALFMAMMLYLFRCDARSPQGSGKGLSFGLEASASKNRARRQCLVHTTHYRWDAALSSFGSHRRASKFSDPYPMAHT